MADNRQVRIEVLQLLLDAKRGRGTAKVEPGYGISGSDLYDKLGTGFTPEEFKAHLDYLEEKGNLIRKPSDTPDETMEAKDLLYLYFYSIAAAGMDEIESKETEKENILATEQNSELPSDARRVFIVHGHDLDSLEKLDHLLRKIGLEPERFDSLKKEGSPTIIEVLERSMPTCAAVIALLTPDDEGRKRPALDGPSDTPEPLKPRARQNVLIEAGYAIISRRNRSLIVALGGVEIPSDFDGIHRLEDRCWSKELAGKVAKRFSQMGFTVNLGAVI